MTVSLLPKESSRRVKPIAGWTSFLAHGTAISWRVYTFDKVWIVCRYFNDDFLRPRSRVFLPSRRKPPCHAHGHDECRNANCIVHVGSCNRPAGREEQDNANEDNPSDCDRIHRSAPASHCVWARDERDSVLVDAVCEDDGDVA